MRQVSFSGGPASREHLARGARALRERRIDDARLAFELAIDADSDCVEAYLALSRLRFPGPTYLDLLARIHRTFRPRTYLEIGVGTGASLQQTLPSTQCVGLDPDLAQAGSLPQHVRLLQRTSNEFFAAPNVEAVLGFSQIELAFIDGLHLFECALDDFCSLEKHMARDGIILIHDCIPFDQRTSERTRSTRFWTGDVWRVIPSLLRYRPDLDVLLVECPPSGLAIVRRLDPTSRLLANRRDEVITYGQSLKFREGGLSHLRIVKNDWVKLAPLFIRTPP